MNSIPVKAPGQCRELAGKERGEVRRFTLRATKSFTLVLLTIAATASLCGADPPPDAPAGSAAKTYRNPIIPYIGPADPAVIRYEGRYYLYPTWDGKGYDVFVSADLVHWEQKPKCFVDPRGGAWAPDVFHNKRGDGKFYLYYTVDKPGGGKLVGVAVADSPLGPFADRGTLATGAIDAHLFQDDDGALYLYYVNVARRRFKILVQPMSDPLTKCGPATVVLQPTDDWEKRRGTVTEGPWMLKHDGVYYLMYSGSGANGPDYAIGYAAAGSPLGPFTKYSGNPIAKRGNGVFGPGHHCVVTGPDGGLWMVYHQQSSEEIGWKRFLAIDPLWFDESGDLHAKTTRGTDEPISPAVRLPSVAALAERLPCRAVFMRIADRPAFVLMPERPKKGEPVPWVWYAPTLPSHPDPSHEWMFHQWLDDGIAIAGVDVGESYGNPRGCWLYSALYETLVRDHGLAPRACLLPQSRGGLMLYNWADENPDKVACIGGIYPVCNLQSWPGLARACPAYGLTEAELADKLDQHNPISRLEPLARAGVPILHLHGDSDRVVPLEANSAELASRYRALGGKIDLIVVPGKGHQVCPEFFHRQELVDFVARHARSITRQKEKP